MDIIKGRVGDRRKKSVTHRRRWLRRAPTLQFIAFIYVHLLIKNTAGTAALRKDMDK
ncbi:hypothetical protein [Kamptonema formosum]|uniref:hypothetical protein n=1 Tax=Kamptonema formosum TaxID=331992 RepID=UPI00138ACC8C|nr:hypothetical protein [Kamptonema formosum]